MNQEEKRIESFKNCTVPNPANFESRKLAKVGFYSTSNGKEIKCYFCHRNIYKFPTDLNTDVVQLHLRTNSSCPLIRRRQTDNIEHPPIELDNILPPHFDDVTGIGVETKYPEFVFLKKRKDSFSQWPLTSPNKDDLAIAGFFALGEEDKVACFSCGLGLMQFEETDVPFEEHARWGPLCDFLVQTKGEDYIREIKEKYSED